jgi:hypothetical protein
VDHDHQDGEERGEVGVKGAGVRVGGRRERGWDDQMRRGVETEKEVYVTETWWESEGNDENGME